MARTNAFLALQSLGVGILAGACITKLPQVLAIVRSRSVEGISMLSIEMELYCNLVHVCYGWFNSLAVTAYGEAGVILLQNLALLGFIYLLKRASILRPVAMLTVAALVLFPVALEQLSAATMTTLYDMNSTIFVASKLPQIRKAFQEVRNAPCVCPGTCMQLLEKGKPDLQSQAPSQAPSADYAVLWESNELKMLCRVRQAS